MLVSIIRYLSLPSKNMSKKKKSSLRRYARLTQLDKAFKEPAYFENVGKQRGKHITGMFSTKMVTSQSEWLELPMKHQTSEGQEQAPSASNPVVRRHLLFPPITANQFLVGSKEYIPLFHDGVKDQAMKEYGFGG